MQDVFSRQALADNITENGPNHPDTRLKICLTGRNPDDGLSEISHVKGYAFLQTIEKSVGRENFDTFLTEYFKSHAFQPITTEGLLQTLFKEMVKTPKGKIRANKIFEKAKPDNHITTVQDLQKILK